MKIFKKVLIISLAVIPFLLLLHIFFHTVLLEEVSVTNDSFLYTNKKWGYKINLSNEWKRSRKFISQTLWLTNFVEFSNRSNNLKLFVSYNQFFEEDNHDLMKFVNDDAKYGEDNQGITTDSIEEISKSDDRWLIKWSGRYVDEFFDQYYIFDRREPPLNLIHKLEFSSSEPLTDSQKDIILQIVNNFQTY